MIGKRRFNAACHVYEPAAGLPVRPANPSITIVVPALNEARNLELILPELPADVEVILVDGNSSDDTVEVARRARPGIKIITQTRKGKGNALAAGFEAATGDIIVMFDADGSADPAEIPDFVGALVAGADFAKGSRNLELAGSEDITRLRDSGNAALNALANVLFRTSFTDLCYGYNAFWRDILTILDLPAATISGAAADEMLWGDGFEIETLLNCRVAAARLRVKEVPSVERQRVHGASNLNAASDGMRVLRTLLVERLRLRRQDERPVDATDAEARTRPDVIVDVSDTHLAEGHRSKRGLTESESPGESAADLRVLGGR